MLRARNSNVRCRTLCFPPLSLVSACDLLDHLLQFDPDRRYTVEQALRHPYLEELHCEDDEVRMRCLQYRACSLNPRAMLVVPVLCSQSAIRSIFTISTLSTCKPPRTTCDVRPSSSLPLGGEAWLHSLECFSVLIYEEVIKHYKEDTFEVQPPPEPVGSFDMSQASSAALLGAD